MEKIIEFAKKHKKLLLIAAYWLLLAAITPIAYSNGQKTDRGLLAIFYVGLFGAMCFICIMVKPFLSVNFTVKRHILTPFLFLPHIILLTVFYWFVIQNMALNLMTFFKFFFFVIAAFCTVGVLSSSNHPVLLAIYSGAASVFIGACLSFVAEEQLIIGTFVYMPLIIGAALGVILCAANILIYKKTDITEEKLSKMFEKYLDKVFKRVPFSDDMLELRQRLSEKLHGQAEKLKYTGGGYVIYNKCVESLGDFSREILKYKRNVVASFAFVNNGTVNILLGVLSFFNFLFIAAFGLKGRPGELTPIIVFAVVAYVSALLVMRLINNFRFKKHKLTSVLSAVVIIAVAYLILLFREVDDNVQNKEAVARIVNIAVVAVAAVSAISETVIRLMYRKKENTGEKS